MKRQGRYTKPQSPFKRHRSLMVRKWQAFRGMSRRKKALVIGGPIAAFLILTPVITYLVLARDISDPERLMNRNHTGVQLLDKTGQVFFSTGHSETLKRLPLSEISDDAEKAIVSSEDKHFYEHEGVSFTGMLAALFANITNQDLTAYGGSTITQQLVKNTLLSSDKTFFRKYQEIAMAVAVDRQYSKDEILDMYLNSVYYGEGAFGIDEAAKAYFNKPANSLDLAESTMLVGILPAPSAFSPITGDAAQAKKQQERVLRRMVEDGKISEAQKQQAQNEELTYAAPKAAEVNVAPHFTEMVIDELDKRYGEETVKRSGYRVKTTLDLKWQKEAEDIVKDRIAISTPGGGRNAALVAIDPKTGAVRALIGSSDYDNPTFGKVNMANSARQPGSSFKPIYYTEALNEKIITAATVLHDEPTDFGGWKPNNYDFKFRGDITVRNALAQSLNIPAGEVMQKLGVSTAVAKAQEMGLSTIKSNKNYGLPLALGAAEVKPIDMASAYSAFANQGVQHEKHLIESIDSKYGERIFTANPKEKRVQSVDASFIISDILSDNTARAPTFGARLNIPGKKVAVKTGSTDDNRDAWTMGFTPNVAVGVWVGNNENEVMTAGGSSMAGPIWKSSISAFMEDLPDESFSPPSDVVKRAICSGPARGTQEYFITGTEPSQNCEPAKQEKKDEKKEETQQPQTTIPSTQPKDSDKDGVLDDRDKCPNTPVGVQVDSDGCVIPTQTVDSDNDGVVDKDDNCPATPPGTKVDSHGCPIVTTPPGPTGMTATPFRYYG
jgi:penicillin-binding protein 1A